MGLGKEITLKMEASSDCRKDSGNEPMDLIEEKIELVPGELIKRQYVKGRQIGKGGSSTCHEIISLETNKMSTAKIIKKSSLETPRAQQRIITEIKIHHSLDNPNIVGFEHTFEDEQNIYILLEHCPNQTLKELLEKRKRLKEFEVQRYLIQLITALKYLHGKRIIHRDIKLSNLLLSDNMELKLCDFGLAVRLESNQERRETICGTRNYISPEMLEKKGYSYEVDIWALGIVM
eukprot:TRINITY_DN1768_c0_g2_i12.p1 TRINITY_DN1768_c0_g2~~TRINITY_DN1768_c0_g2_i12.p1  ORF type:complete len:234 (+),score=29.07 TRINITY_DN1768_c0_g2_i12:96-797(+)